MSALSLNVLEAGELLFVVFDGVCDPVHVHAHSHAHATSVHWLATFQIEEYPEGQLVFVKSSLRHMAKHERLLASTALICPCLSLSMSRCN